MATPDYAKGVEMMRRLDESGYAWAQRQMRKMYYEGNRVPKDEGIVVEWYQKTTDQGHAYAQTKLGLMYENGRGVLMNYEKSSRMVSESGRFGT